MHDQPTRGPGLSPAEQDDQLQGVVLHHLLDDYPVHFAVTELVSELSGPTAARSEHDDIERAVRDLAGAGLLHHGSGFVWPTRAAMRAGALMAD